MERELLEHQRERELREKERIQRERDKSQTHLSHIPSPHLSSQPPLMLPILHPGSMLPPKDIYPSPLGLTPATRQSPLSAGLLPPNSLAQNYPIPRSSPSLQRHSPHSSIHSLAAASLPPSSNYTLNLSQPQRRSPVIQPSGPLINNTNNSGPLSSQLGSRVSPKPSLKNHVTPTTSIAVPTAASPVIVHTSAAIGEAPVQSAIVKSPEESQTVSSAGEGNRDNGDSA